MTGMAALLALTLAGCGGGTGKADASGSASHAEGAVSAGSTGKADGESADTARASTSSTGGEGKVYKVGILQYLDDASLNQIEQNIEKQLAVRGEELGVTFALANPENPKDSYVKNGQGDASSLQQLTQELLADEVDVIVPIATPAAQIVQSATEGMDLPIVFSTVSDPVGAKVVETMEKPGGNITGTSDALNTEAVMNLILAQIPDIRKVGLLYSNSEDSSAAPIEEAKAFLKDKGISYVEKTGTNTNEIQQAAEGLIAEGVEAVFTPTDNTVMNAQLSIYEKFVKAGVLQFCGADSFALNGAFTGYGVDYAAVGAATGDMVAEILTKNLDPAETPVQTFDSGIAVVNTDVAGELGLDMDAIKKAYAPYCSAVKEIKTAEAFEDK